MLLTSFLQILHIFEEIALEAYTLYKGRYPRRMYLRVASGLIFVNYVILWLLYRNVGAGYYAAFLMVLMSVGNTLAHFILLYKTKEKYTYGYGFPSSVPLGIAGLVLLILLLQYF